MYVIGLLFYIGVTSLYFFSDSIKELVFQAILLAPEISAIIGVITLYPLVIFLSHLVLQKRNYEYGRYLSSQSKLAASASVSFGLIGTFQGLTQMVSTISHAMGVGDSGTDLVERMNIMINSISSALASMSYAFITSICGVAASVLILIALNFFNAFYKKAEEKRPVVPVLKDHTEEMNLLISKVNQVEELNLGVAKKLVGLSAIEEESGKVINLLSDVKGYLNSTLKDISVLTENQMAIQQAIAATLNEYNQLMADNANKYMAQLNSIMGDQREAFSTLTGSIDNVNLTLEKTFAYTQQLPELINRHNKVNEILQTVKTDVINGLQLLSNDVRLIPGLLQSQNTSTNLLIEVQQGFSNNIKEAAAQIIDVQRGFSSDIKETAAQIIDVQQGFSSDIKDAAAQIIDVQHGFSSDIKEAAAQIIDVQHGVSGNIREAAVQIIDVQQGLSDNIQQTTAKLQELIDEQKKARVDSGKVRRSLKEALEIFTDE